MPKSWYNKSYKEQQYKLVMESPVSAVIAKLYMEVFEWQKKTCSLLFQDLELFLRWNSDRRRWKLLKEISQQPTIHLTKKVKNNNKIAFSTLQSCKYKGATLLKDCIEADTPLPELCDSHHCQ